MCLSCLTLQGWVFTAIGVYCQECSPFNRLGGNSRLFEAKGRLSFPITEQAKPSQAVRVMVGVFLIDRKQTADSSQKLPLGRRALASSAVSCEISGL